jgi:hypothetical protein
LAGKLSGTFPGVKKGNPSTALQDLEFQKYNGVFMLQGSCIKGRGKNNGTNAGGNNDKMWL